MTTWGDVEEECASDIGYNLRKSDRYWIIVTSALVEGYDLAIRCAGRWHLELPDDALVFTSAREAEAHRQGLGNLHKTGVMSMGDYWRRGRIPPTPLRFKTSQDTLDRLTRLKVVR